MSEPQPLPLDAGDDQRQAAPPSPPSSRTAGPALAEGPPPAKGPSPPAKAGALEWLTRGASMRAARAALQADPTRDRLLARARVALELGDRARRDVDPPRHGSGVPVALSLYREAAYWALAALARDESARDLAEAFGRAPPEALARAAGGEAEAEAAREALVARSFVDTARLPVERQAEDAARAAAFVRALAEAADAPRRRVRELTVQRFLRFALLFSLLFVAVAAAAVGVRRAAQGPDLAEGKSWQASSSYKGFQPEKSICDGNATNILFHTNEEESPWFEIDLGAPRPVSRVKVRNRSDGFQERAVPLVIETSTDHTSWKQVARREHSFSTWNADFAPTEARYVRARAARRTFLHLERVEVR